MDFIPYGCQDISNKDVEAVLEVLKSDFLTQGPSVPKFENTIKDYCGSKHAIVVNSATSALHIACLSLGVRAGDYVWTSPITFVASANCARFCGANVDFVDIDPCTYNMSVVHLEQKLKKAEMDGKLPKVVIPVHLTGQSCEMDRIFGLSKKYGFKIIEDASHAIGAKYKNKPVGNCEYSDICIFSFHPVKIITTAEGGAVTTNDDALSSKMRLYASHCVTRDESLMDKKSEGAWYYQQVGLGYNYRMTELQAALGISQMLRLDQFVAKRHHVAKSYRKRLANCPVTLPGVINDAYSSYHLFVISVADRLNVFNHLRKYNIGVNVHYIPVHTQPYYRDLGFSEGDFPNAEKYYSECISLPVFSNITEEQIEYVCDRLVEVM